MVTAQAEKEVWRCGHHQSILPLRTLCSDTRTYGLIRPHQKIFVCPRNLLDSTDNNPDIYSNSDPRNGLPTILQKFLMFFFIG
mmetsp:Transcript_7585/g.9731  ORF Transcript_7585/g.9731 Transcript_7585/m.9731 type:complete len:83 (+) Transcript_7585:724-972(+)